ncbi:Txe/YoeB family addiction module toxin [Pseudomonas sp. F1_0610]|uniref:Txe/YoeB family addiction module toxin n=1 Tax=Pseudomonas sp. F1_0610 TaxID=3114284 RepID=UPI0039C46738
MNQKKIIGINTIAFTLLGWEDYQYWFTTDRQMLKKINQLVEAVKRDPFTGIGKPEPLIGQLQGCWSRRINLEHRLVYEVQADSLVILQCRYHYTK